MKSVAHGGIVLVMFLSTCVQTAFAGEAKGKPKPKPAVLLLASASYYTSHDYIKILHSKGYEVNNVPFPGWNVGLKQQDLSKYRELLGKYNVAVFVCGLMLHDPTHAVPPHTRAFIKLVVDYVERGGGVLYNHFCPVPGGYCAANLALTEALGARMLLEQTHDRTATDSKVTAYHARFAYTRALDPTHPITKGLEGIWYPIENYQSHNVSSMPWPTKDGWTVLLRGGKESYSTPIATGVPAFDKLARSKGCDSNIPLIIARQAGKGRVVLNGIHCMFHIMGGHQAGLKRIVSDKGYKGRPSDMDALLFRAIAWLSEPSMAAGRPGGGTTPKGVLDDPLVIKSDVPKRDWAATKWPPAPKQHRGVIGARTARSKDGSGTVAEYVAAAKQAGLDFIAFLDEWEDVTDDQWQSLVKECKDASTGGFTAFPGITLKGVYGGNRFAFGEDFDLPPKKFTKLVNGKKRMFYEAGKGVTAVGLGYHVWRWPQQRGNVRVGSWRHKENPWPYHSERGYDAVAVISAQGPNVQEDLTDGYMHLQNRGESLYACAVTIVRSPDELVKGMQQGMYWNGMSTDVLQMHKTLDNYSQYHVNERCFHYLSNGPRIDEFRFLGTLNYASTDWWRTDLYRLPFRIKVSSDAGLKEVLLMDGNVVCRRWLPQGKKQFVQEVAMAHEAQHNYLLKVTDTKGRQAVSGEYATRNWIMHEIMCMDRNNQMSGSYQKRPDGRSFQSNPRATPWKGNNDVRLFGDYFYGSDKVVGGGVRGHDGVRNSTSSCFLGTVIRGYGMKTAAIWGPEFHRTTDRVVGSPDVLRGWGLTDGRLQLEPGRRPRMVWQDLVPVKPADDYREWGQRTLFTVWPDMLLVEMLERRLSVLKGLDLKKGPVKWDIGTVRPIVPRKLGIRSQGRILYDGPVGEYGLRPSTVVGGLLEAGDYVAFYNGYTSSMAYMVLEGQVRFIACLKTGWITLSVPWDPTRTIIPAGTTVEHTLLAIAAPVLSDNWVADSIQFAELFRHRMGLDGDVPYTIKPSQGRVVSTKYIVKAEAKDGRFVAKTAGVHLPATLPLEVDKLNSNWSCGFYEMDTKRYRPIAVVEGKGYVSLNPLKKKQQFFVGHPVVADDAEVVIGCVQLAARRWALEVHNPTDRARTPQVAPMKDLPPIAFKAFRVNVAPGSSRHFVVARGQVTAKP